MNAITITGHRGAMAHAPENTAPSLALAHEHGADEIELDIRLSSDGVPVVIHDGTMKRVTSGRREDEVVGLTWDELRAIELDGGARLLRFEQVLEQTTLPLQVELKADGAAEVVADVLNARTQDQDRCTLTSFQRDYLIKVGEVMPWARRGFIVFGYEDEALAQAVELGVQTLYTGWEGLTVEMVARIHDRGLRAAGWLLDEPARARVAVELGVDGVTADDPQAARAWLEQAAEESAA
ncbi:glycerophosphodiester phosphodiesterase [Microlunatus parietis]|uniref:Glycerophosphoryl diester phosphodiesterase n=1 Tax=Microlunatus parietis TaxID=682979 RepID=A0A7Y9I595_9ACTN|nr:glycerophosphodiester phosphodiesterase family protein [Microlunatus parietis]NYE70452.1 glycerophosphoryl diester phosphodiesterase [Microlunatus parietis]